MTTKRSHRTYSAGAGNGESPNLADETKSLNLRLQIVTLHGSGKKRHWVMNVFNEMGSYWAEVADESQTQRQIQFLKNTLQPNGYILDLACGTGRHTIPLSKEGYLIIGLDISDKLLRIAKQRSGAVELVRGDMRFLPFKNETFMATISMDTSFGYLPSETEDIKSLAEVRRILRQCGVAIIDVFNRTNIVAKYHKSNIEPKRREYPSFFLLQKRRVSDTGDWLCDSWTVREKFGGQMRVFEHIVRLYSTKRLHRLLEKAGFGVKQKIGDYEGQKYDSNSSRLILIACKN